MKIESVLKKKKFDGTKVWAYWGVLSASLAIIEFYFIEYEEKAQRFKKGVFYSILPNIQMFYKYLSQILSVRNTAMMDACKLKTFAFDRFFQADGLF